jgi:natural product precursor
MKKKIKLSEIRKNELQKEEMHSLNGGVHPSCAIACSCSCMCSTSGIPERNNDMDTKSSTYRTNSQNFHQNNNTGRATGSLHF